MSTAAVSGLSRSAGPWACRRPPTTSARPARARRVAVEDERLLERIERAAGGQLSRLRLPAQLESASAGGRAGRSRPGQAADANPRHPGRQAQGQAVAHHPVQSRGVAPARPCRAQLHRRRAEPALGRRLVLSALLGGAGVLRVRARRLQPQGGGLAARRPHAHHLGPRRTADGALAARARRRRRAWCITAIAAVNTRRSITPRPWPITVCSPRSGRSATPTTTRSQRASSTASRPS